VLPELQISEHWLVNGLSSASRLNVLMAIPMFLFNLLPN
jgi:hypothetical protein